MDDARFHDALDALSRLYLTGPVGSADADDVSAPAARPAVEVQAVLMGHLPGIAAPWVGQYADEQVRLNRGDVGVLHIDTDRIEVEVYLAGAGEPGETDTADTGAAGLLGLVDRLAERVGVWLICFSDHTLMRQLAPDLLTWTVLTGADDAAIVGAYRLLKELLQDRPAQHVETAQPIRMMLMGCDEERAHLAVEKVSRAASMFLNTSIELAGCRQRIEPVRCRRLGHFDVDAAHAINGQGRLWEQLLGCVLGDRTPVLVEAHQSVEAPVEDTEPIEPPVELIPTAPEPDELAPEAEPAASVELEPPLPIESVAEPLELEPVTIGAADNLAEHLSAAAAMEARCPHEPDIQLALDDDGQLHLMQFANGCGAEQVVRQLLDTRRWAVEHLALLALTCRDRPVNTNAVPQIHVFTDQPKAYGAWAYTGAPDQPAVRLHLLKSIPAGAQTLWVHEPLN